MTLDEAFAIYPNDQLMYRDYRPECDYPISILKGLQDVTKTALELGEDVPPGTLDDVYADDWEAEND